MLKLLFAILFVPSVVFGCCYGNQESISEIMNYPDNDLRVFTCTIIKTFVTNTSYESVAVIDKSFYGDIKDTVYVRTGGFTTAGGEKLIPGSEWLIFTHSNDGLHFGAIVCDHKSSIIKFSPWTKRRHKTVERGKQHLRFLNEYEEIVKSRFTGFKVFYYKDRKIAEGHYKNGKAIGKWIHYSMRDDYKHNLVKSVMYYKNGKKHGDYIHYYNNLDTSFISEIKKYKDDRILLSKIPKGGEIKYIYINDKDRLSKNIVLDINGEVCKIENRYHKDYANSGYFSISYRNGYYLNKRDSNSYEIPGEGHYFRGLKVGSWKYFTKKGKLIRTEHYDYPDTTIAGFNVYDDNRKIIISGKLDGNKRVGVWKRYDTKIVYNTEGILLYKIRSFNYGHKIFTPYKDFKKNGYEINYSKSNAIKSITHYVDGQKNGTYISYDNSGNIVEELSYFCNRATTIYSKSKSKTYINGYLEGEYKQISSKTGKILWEGTYWRGYIIGDVTRYNEDGSYTVTTYNSDTTKLMYLPQILESAIITKKYDKNGKLIKTISH